MKKQNKTINVEGVQCLVQTLREWLNQRITSLRIAMREEENDFLRAAELQGRYIELMIIRDKINDGRIDSIQ